ncbi:MAG: hypothetical protein ACLTGT_01185 [Oscillospiraceae bacterium]
MQEMDCGNMSLALLREDICAGGLTLQEAQVSDIFWITSRPPRRGSSSR